MEKYLHAINCLPGMSYFKMKKLYQQLGSWQEIWRYLTKQSTGNKFDIEGEYAKIWDQDISLISQNNPEYPKLLKELADAPFLLYRKGAKLNELGKMVAVVGTRKSSSYGEKIGFKIAEEIAKCGGVVVSGLAFGIDAIAHFGAVNNQKPTIAVLASGVAEITPANNRSVAEKILQYGGTLLSEYPAGTPAFPSRFLERNRIISGLCQATIVIEAGNISGALSTARHAVNQNRDVYALPGEITRPQAQGCLKLIYDGAYPIIGIEDLMSKLGFKFTQKMAIKFSPTEQKIIQQLKHESCSIDELSEKTGMEPQTLYLNLSMLEIKGIVKTNAALKWEITNP